MHAAPRRLVMMSAALFCLCCGTAEAGILRRPAGRRPPSAGDKGSAPEFDPATYKAPTSLGMPDSHKPAPKGNPRPAGTVHDNYPPEGSAKGCSGPDDDSAKCFLGTNGLLAQVGVFVEQGFETAADILDSDLTEDDLKELGLGKMRDRKALLVAIQEAKAAAAAAAAKPPPPPPPKKKKAPAPPPPAKTTPKLEADKTKRKQLTADLLDATVAGDLERAAALIAAGANPNGKKKIGKGEAKWPAIRWAALGNKTAERKP